MLESPRKGVVPVFKQLVLLQDATHTNRKCQNNAQAQKEPRGVWKVAQRLGRNAILVIIQEGLLEEATSEERMRKTLTGTEGEDMGKSMMRQEA